MKLKYYLKGLGLGMLLSAAVLGALLYLSNDGTQKMTDEEVIIRARQLGMVEDLSIYEPVTPNVPVVEETESEETATEGTWSNDDAFLSDQETDDAMGQAGEEVSEEVDEGLSSADQGVEEAQ